MPAVAKHCSQGLVSKVVSGVTYWLFLVIGNMMSLWVLAEYENPLKNCSIYFYSLFLSFVHCKFMFPLKIGLD